MNRFPALLVIWVLAVVSSAQDIDYAAYLYVAPNGNDAHSGRTSNLAFATIERALREIDGWNHNFGWLPSEIHVVLAPGDYIIEKPVVIPWLVLVTPNVSLTIEAKTPGTARLLAGCFVRGFEKVTDDATLARLDESGRGNVYAADLKSQGIADYGAANGGGLELFFDGGPMQIARWPNEGFVKIVEEAGGDRYDIRGTWGDRIGRWVYDGDRPSRWLEERDGWLYGYWFWDWSAEHQKIKTIDPAKHTIEVEKPYHGYGYRKGQWYYALNLLSEIDTPGEWYLDRESGTLYFWPPAPLEDAEVFVSLLPNLVTFENARHTTLQGVVIEGARDTAVRINGGEFNRLAACTIRNCGGDAVAVSGGNANSVVGCDIYDIGGTGISLTGGDRATYARANHTAENNHIYRYSRWYRMYRPGIYLNGVGQRVAHNLINDAPHMAVQFNGNDHVIEYNEIHDVCYESNDAGAIYAGRDWTERGTQIRYNFLHHITGYENRGCVGVYLDDMFCGTNIYGNLFYKVYRAAFIGGGRDNAIRNNLFVDCPKAIHVDNRAQNWAADTVPTTMTERLRAMPIAESPWKERFPQLLTILDDEPAAPKGNLIEHNVVYGKDWDSIADGARPHLSLDNNFIERDPKFRHPDRFTADPPKATDFTLEKGSPAYATGFEPLPLEFMGIDKARTRATWPVSHRLR